MLHLTFSEARNESAGANAVLLLSPIDMLTLIERWIHVNGMSSTFLSNRCEWEKEEGCIWLVLQSYYAETSKLV